MVIINKAEHIVTNQQADSVLTFLTDLLNLEVSYFIIEQKEPGLTLTIKTYE